MKRVVSIQDISCLGRCSLTVALPVISAMGVECAIVPTAVLSTHTAFPGFTCKDLTDQLTPIARHWRSQGVTFDAISTGYIASAPQARQVLDFVASIRSPETLLVVDPAMADHGKLYAGFDDDFPKAMAQVVAQADVALPNLTEACLLTGTPYREDMDEPFARELLQKVASLGAKGWCSPVRPSPRTSWALWATTAPPARTLHVSARGIPRCSTARGTSLPPPSPADWCGAWRWSRRCSWRWISPWTASSPRSATPPPAGTAWSLKRHCPRWYAAWSSGENKAHNKGLRLLPEALWLVLSIMLHQPRQ